MRIRHDHASLRRTARRRSIAVGGIVLAALATVGTTEAATLSYVWTAGSAFSFDDDANANLGGTFKIDPPGSSLSSGDIIIDGLGQESGTYAPVSYGSNAITFSNPAGTLDLEFGSILSSGPEKADLESAVWSSSDGEIIQDASIVVGGVQLSDSIAAAAPEPSTWVLFGLGVAGIALIRGRRKSSVAAPVGAAQAIG
jgi:hypothetical protein